MKAILRPATILGAAVFLALSTPLLAQDDAPAPPADERFEDEIQVDEVLLDVRVTDRDGNVILGLEPSDFVVEEDGVRQPVENAWFYSNRQLQGEVPESLRGKIDPDAAPLERYFVLFFEDQRQRDAATSVNLTRRQLEAARRAKEWVRTLPPSDLVAVASYDTRLKVQTDFTADRGALASAIDAAATGRDPLGGNWPSRSGDEASDASLLAGLPQGKDLDQQSRRVEEAIVLLADAAGEIRGRKNLVYFTTGFGEVNSFGNYIPDRRYYPPMMRSLNDANVAVYTVDLLPQGTTSQLSNSSNLLAEDTGGRFFFNFVDFKTPLEQIEDSNSGYYLLSYRSPHPEGESGYQEVSVDVTNPEFQVEAREGYLYGPAR